MYVSNVIDQLKDELEEQITAVTEHLRWALRGASRRKSFVPEPVSAGVSLGQRPDRISVPTLDPRPFVTVWERITWGLRSDAGRFAIVRSSQKYQAALADYSAKWHPVVQERTDQIAKFDRESEAHSAQIAHEREAIEALFERASGGDIEALWRVFETRFADFMGSNEPLPGGFRVTYSSGSHRAIVEFDLPGKSVVPAAKSVRFLKTTGEHRYSYRTDADMRRLYAAFVAQAVLGVVNAVFELSNSALIETVGVNGVVEAADPATGVQSTIPIVSVVVARDAWERIEVSSVDPIACLKHLSAVVSRSPAEVAPIRPIVSLDKSDPRFVAESDVLGDLDARPNLMELTPNEFEGLVQNLFAKMGLDTKQTRPSRDGGVDAIAYDPRPVLGGKIVIQAKRYKGTVGVSAVRDLFGTLQNEGGSKGILVTTSGYGSASFEFAKNKPLELIDGGNLLYLLKEHAGIDARIVMPEDWVDGPLAGE